MFTGLVQKVGRLLGFDRKEGGASLRVACPGWPAAEDPLSPGESVAVQGCCLTVRTVRPDGFEADVLEETLSATALGALAPGAALNLERALRPADRLGGHVVQGHVDGLARLVSVVPEGRDLRLRLACAAAEARYVVRKGSVALDGVSLTVAAVPAEGLFEVCLIPTTRAETSLGERREGDALNLETDVLGRYVEKLLAAGPAPAGGAITEDTLRKAGW